MRSTIFRAGWGVVLAAWLMSAACAGPAEEYADRVRALRGRGTPAQWLDLADFCEGHLLWDQREEALKEASGGRGAEADRAHERLGERKVGSLWMPVEEAQSGEVSQNEGRGKDFYGDGWVPRQRVDAMRRTDSQACGWDVRIRVNRPHVSLFSAKETLPSLRLADILESAVEAYLHQTEGVWALRDIPAPFRVYWFPDAPTFVRISSAQTGEHLPEGAAGFYNKNTKVLYLNGGGTRDPEGMAVKTAAHEILHACDDLMAGKMVEAAMWLVEGRAIDHGYSVRGRQVLPGWIRLSPTDARAQLLSQEYERTSLSDLLRMDHATFMGRAHEHYALSWGIVHFLQYGDAGRHRDGFRRFLRGYPERVAASDLEAALGTTLAEIEPAFREYIRTVMLPAAQASQE